jgi:ATP-dependent Clp protease protease subunit
MQVSLETKEFDERMLLIQGDITQESAFEFARAMRYLNSRSQNPIQIFINSPGGSIDAGMLYIDVIQSSPAPVYMYCLGCAYSMAALIFACGTKGNRFLLPSSKLMLHEPVISSPIMGNASSIKSISDSLLLARKKVNMLLSKHTGKTMHEIEEATKFEHYFSAEESLAFGLCDRIINFSEMVTEVI